ncbi:hypothetical protein VF21_07665 [Pseudogymnoascus sp. 05NY08]|nr:hypothetical protein VF21_07665 [Pseudogymnoascus sp. 05NY08]
MAPPTIMSDDVYDDLRRMRELMRELQDAALDLCRKYLDERAELLPGEAKIDILLQLNGRALDYDNLDPAALRRMMEGMIETSQKLENVIVGVQVSLGRLEVAAKEHVRSEKIGNAWLMCQRLLPLAGQLSEAHAVVVGLVKGAGNGDQEGILRDLKEGEKRRKVKTKLQNMLSLWNWSTEWLVPLTLLREVVVSVREEVADEKMTMGPNTVDLAVKKEESEEMDLLN